MTPQFCVSKHLEHPQIPAGVSVAQPEDELSPGFEAQLIMQPRNVDGCKAGTVHHLQAVQKKPEFILFTPISWSCSAEPPSLFLHTHTHIYLQFKGSLSFASFTVSLSEKNQFRTDLIAVQELLVKGSFTGSSAQRASVQVSLLLTEERLIIYNYPDCLFLHCKVSSAS